MSCGLCFSKGQDKLSGTSSSVSRSLQQGSSETFNSLLMELETQQRASKFLGFLRSLSVECKGYAAGSLAPSVAPSLPATHVAK